MSYDWEHHKFVEACANGELATVRQRISSGVSLERPDDFGDRLHALAAAAEKGQLEVVQLLLSSGASVDTQALSKYGSSSQKEDTALLRACRRGQSAVAEVLLKAGAKPDRVCGILRYTALVEALSYSGSAECVRLLLHYGANPSGAAGTREIPLLKACGASSCEDAQVVELLLAAGADKKAVTSTKETALHLAARWCTPGKVARLLGAGFDPNAVDKGGCTALHYAAESSSNSDSLPLLLQAGGNLEATNARGFTAFEIALKNKNFPVTKLAPLLPQRPLSLRDLSCTLGSFYDESQEKKALWLLQKGAPVGPYEQTHPLIIAAQWGSVALTEALLAKTSDINYRGQAIFTPLQRAAYDGHQKVVSLLIARGAKVDESTKDGETALHLAARQKRSEIAGILVGAGADPLKRNKKNRPPWFYADPQTRARIEAAAPQLKERLRGQEDETRQVRCSEIGGASCARCGFQEIEAAYACPWCQKRALQESDYQVLHGNPYTPASDTEVEFTYACGHCGQSFRSSYHIDSGSPSLSDSYGSYWRSSDGGKSWSRSWGISE